MIIRKADLNDLAQIYEIEKTDIDAWSYKTLEEDFKYNKYSNYFVADLEKNVVGFLSIMDICGEIHINNIMVSKSFRGEGIGEKLLFHGLSYYQDANVIGFTLEVREDNLPAISLYKKFGFKVCGSRKNYYKNNKNAFIMWKMPEEKKC